MLYIICAEGHELYNALGIFGGRKDDTLYNTICKESRVASERTSERDKSKSARGGPQAPIFLFLAVFGEFGE